MGQKQNKPIQDGTGWAECVYSDVSMTMPGKRNRREVVPFEVYRSTTGELRLAAAREGAFTFEDLDRIDPDEPILVAVGDHTGTRGWCLIPVTTEFDAEGSTVTVPLDLALFLARAGWALQLYDVGNDRGVPITLGAFEVLYATQASTDAPEPGMENVLRPVFGRPRKSG